MGAGSDAACHMSLQIGAWDNLFMVCILLLYLHVSILYWLGTCIGKFDLLQPIAREKLCSV